MDPVSAASHLEEKNPYWDPSSPAANSTADPTLPAHAGASTPLSSTHRSAASAATAAAGKASIRHIIPRLISSDRSRPGGRLILE
ncbi:hypothetical protein ZWY2020_019707 [Hordeum vulgare]|nr:hypothetical protein ZWY2020_019707 [Hordeum vulgare]